MDSGFHVLYNHNHSNHASQLGTQQHEITAQLVSSGTELYRARDLKLKGEVAIKILPEEFSRDSARSYVMKMLRTERIDTFVHASALLVFFVVVLGFHSTVMAQSSGGFIATGDMNISRGHVIGTVLASGKVLIRGLVDGTAELYDPNTGTFTSAGLPLPWSSPDILLGDGRVFMLGNDGTKNVTYIYDPTVQTITQTGSSVTNQLGGAAILLLDGKILIAGGVMGRPVNGISSIATPELYDPSTGAFTATGFVTKSSVFFTGGPVIAATSLLPDGRVLFAGEPNSEVYDPVSGSFSLTGSMTTPCFMGNDKPDYISGRTSTLLQNGKVLLTGGEQEDCGLFANAELYDPDIGQFTPTGDMTRLGTTTQRHYYLMALS